MPGNSLRASWDWADRNMALELHLVALVLLAALMHASWNALIKISGDRFFTMATVMGAGSILLLPVLPFVQFPPSAAVPYLFTSFVLHLAYYGVLIFAYRYGDLSVVYPIARGSSPVLIAIGAYLLAGQALGPVASAGLALASGGMCLFAFERGLPSRHFLKPLVIALTVGLSIAGYTVVDGLGLRRTPSAIDYIAWLSFLDGLPLMLWALLFRTPDYSVFLKMEWKKAALGGALSLVAYGLVLYVLSTGSMAHVSALRETSVLFAVIIGALSLKEKFGPVRWIAALAIVGGVVTMQFTG